MKTPNVAVLPRAIVGKKEGMKIQTKRLAFGDRELARKLFGMMATVFAVDNERLSDGYLDRLLSREDFWVIAALIENEVVGGVTAHTLSMTRLEVSEVFIFDVAVREDYQRKGIGRYLITVLLEAAAAVGIHEVFVAADNDDAHALDFYQAVGGAASPVTLFTFSKREHQGDLAVNHLKEELE